MPSKYLIVLLSQAILTTCSTEAINSKVGYSPFDVKFSNVQSGSFDLCVDSKTNASSRHHEEFPVTLPFSKEPKDTRKVVEKILMHGFLGEMHLDGERVNWALPSRELHIITINGTREVGGTFFNFFQHKPTFKVNTWEQRKVSLTGGPLTAPYILDQFHFHVYCTRKEAEKSTLDRVQVPGELHLVFFREKYTSYSNAMLRYKDGLAVVAIYLEVGDEERSIPQIANLSKLVEYIAKDGNLRLPVTAAIQQLTGPLEKANAKYDTYRGNLVEPIKCENCVDVFVMEERFSISVKQMTEFRKAPHCVENDWAF